MSTYTLAPRVLSGYTYKGFQYAPQNFNDGRESLFHDVIRDGKVTTIDFDVHSELPLSVFHKFVDDTLMREEANSDATIEENGVGFTGFDSQILTSFAKRVLEWEQEVKHKYQTALSPKQMEVLQKRMPKYAKQLVSIFGQKFDEKYPVIEGK